MLSVIPTVNYKYIITVLRLFQKLHSTLTIVILLLGLLTWNSSNGTIRRGTLQAALVVTENFLPLALKTTNDKGQWKNRIQSC